MLHIQAPTDLKVALKASSCTYYYFITLVHNCLSLQCICLYQELVKPLSPLTLKGLKCLNTTLSSAPKYKCCVSRRNILTELGMQIPNSGPTVTCWSTWIFFLPNEKKFCGHKALQSATNNSWDTYDKLYCQMILPSPLYVIHLFPNTQPQSRQCVFFFCLAHEPVSLRVMSDKTIQDILSPTFIQTIPNLPRVGDEEAYLPYVAKNKIK